MGQERVELDLRWSAIKRARVWTESETTDNQSLERFWRDGIWGVASWGSPGGPLRWYPDAATDSVYGTYRTDSGADLFDPDMTSENYSGSWSVQMPLMIQVPGTESLGTGSSRATIGVSALTTSSSTVDGTGFTTASISPSSNALVLLGVIQTATAETPTVTGNGLTWVNVTTVAVDSARRLCVFRALGSSPSAGTVTITYGSSQASCAWSIVQCTNVDTSGSAGSGAVVQSATGTATAGTSVAATLSALEDSSNVNVSFVGLDTNASVTPDADFTELGDDGEANNNITIESEWALNQTNCTATFATADAGIIAVEVKSGLA
jgi:hypothetical protein